MSGVISIATAKKTRLVILMIIALCTCLELLLQMGDILTNVPRLRATAYEYLGFWPGLLDGWRENYFGQRYLMFITYGFVHGGLLHLVMNMYTLWVLAEPMSRRISTGSFIQLYTGSLIGGGLGYALLMESPIPMIGASGALFGLAGALTVWLARDNLGLGLMRAIGPIVSYLLGINIVMYWALDGQLAWQTHLGGFVVGAIFGWVLDTDDKGGASS